MGLDVTNLDQAIQRLENVLRDGIAPRIPGIRFLRVGQFERGPALALRVPRSWATPHMVVFQQSGKFFTRHAGGKHQLDINELRDAFFNTRSASERAEDFRTGRLGRVIGGGYCCYPAMSSDPWLVPLRKKPTFARLLGTAEQQHRVAKKEFARLEGDRILGVSR